MDIQQVATQAALEWERTPALRAEFLSQDHYIAWRKADARGLVRIHTARAAAPAPAKTAHMADTGQVDTAAAALEWENTPALRAEFLSEEHYIAWRKADARGLVRIHTAKAARGADTGQVGAASPLRDDYVAWRGAERASDLGGLHSASADAGPSSTTGARAAEAWRQGDTSEGARRARQQRGALPWPFTLARMAKIAAGGD